MVEIREVKTRKERLTFIEFPNKMYRDNPYYVPSLVSDEMTNIDEKKNPAFEFCDMRFFLNTGYIHFSPFMLPTTSGISSASA